jgi:hypothetical protein
MASYNVLSIIFQALQSGAAAANASVLLLLPEDVTATSAVETAVAGANLRAKLSLFDTLGNTVDFGPVPTVAGTVSLRGSTSVDVTLSNAVDGSYGYVGIVRVAVAGSYTVSAAFGGAGLKLVAPTKLTIRPGPAVAAASTIEGAGLYGAAAGAAASFTVTVRDAYGNALGAALSETFTCAAKLVPGATLLSGSTSFTAATTIDLKQGVCTVTYTLTESAPYTAIVSFGKAWQMLLAMSMYANYLMR